MNNAVVFKHQQPAAPISHTPIFLLLGISLLLVKAPLWVVVVEASLETAGYRVRSQKHAQS